MRLRLVLLAAIVILPAGGLAQAGKVYKWTDAAGNFHFADQPIDASNAEEVKIRSFSGPAEVIPDEAGSGADEVKILTTTWCRVCRSAKAYLAAKGISFSEYDVETSDVGRQEYRRLGERACPLFSWANKGWMVSVRPSWIRC